MECKLLNVAPLPAHGWQVSDENVIKGITHVRRFGEWARHDFLGTRNQNIYLVMIHFKWSETKKVMRVKYGHKRRTNVTFPSTSNTVPLKLKKKKSGSTRLCRLVSTVTKYMDLLRVK